MNNKTKRTNAQKRETFALIKSTHILCFTVVLASRAYSWKNLKNAESAHSERPFSYRNGSQLHTWKDIFQTYVKGLKQGHQNRPQNNHLWPLKSPPERLLKHLTPVTRTSPLKNTNLPKIHILGDRRLPALDLVSGTPVIYRYIYIYIYIYIRNLSDPGQFESISYHIPKPYDRWPNLTE